MDTELLLALQTALSGQVERIVKAINALLVRFRKESMCFTIVIHPDALIQIICI